MDAESQIIATLSRMLQIQEQSIAMQEQSIAMQKQALENQQQAILHQHGAIKAQAVFRRIYFLVILTGAMLVAYLLVKILPHLG